MKILWVENNIRFVRTVCRTFLAAHAVTATPSIADAREFLETENFDVVLLDYDLDDGKGDEIARMLRLQTPRPIVIAVSAHEAGNTALEQAGVDAVCAKLQFTSIEDILRTYHTQNGTSPDTAISSPEAPL
jgi:DNA-binding response OmpR family regulator